MKYYISDLHLSHSKVIEYENRPFSDVTEMNNCLITNWNSRVQEDDEVYVLGDFAFCKGEETNKLLDRLNGKKYLIIGNHDSFVQDKKFDETKFEWIRRYMKIKDNDKTVVLVHYTIIAWEEQNYGSIHLYGHIHSNSRENHYSLLTNLRNAYNVGVDIHNFMPKTLEELIF